MINDRNEAHDPGLRPHFGFIDSATRVRIRQEVRRLGHVRHRHIAQCRRFKRVVDRIGARDGHGKGWCGLEVKRVTTMSHDVAVWVTVTPLGGDGKADTDTSVGASLTSITRTVKTVVTDSMSGSVV